MESGSHLPIISRLVSKVTMVEKFDRDQALISQPDATIMSSGGVRGSRSR
jgi:hypothetical protein